MEADSSGYATGAVTSQQCEDNKWHLVRLMSKSLSDPEMNYEIHDKKLLSVFRGLEECGGISWRKLDTQ